MVQSTQDARTAEPQWLHIVAEILTATHFRAVRVCTYCISSLAVSNAYKLHICVIPPSFMSRESLGLLTPMRAACLVRVSTECALA